MARPGWYNDETDPTLARWHDGEGWTEHVVVKAEWEAAGHEPPPPDELDPVTWPRPSRALLLLASAAVAALFVVGVTLAGSGDDPSPDRSATTRATDAQAARSSAATAPPTSESDAALTADDGLARTSAEASDGEAADEGAVAPTGNRRSAASATTRPTTRASTGGVERTERSTRSQRNTQPVAQVGGEDETSVGNTTRRSIDYRYEPPPEPPPTEPTTAPPPSDPGPETPGGP